MQNKGIGISHLPNQRYRSFCKKGLNYNIMIIGSNGSGKSTFVNNLFRTELMPKNLDAYTLENQKNAIDVQKALVTFQVTRAPFVDKKFNIDIKIVEVDNVGDQINNIGCWIPIADYINDMYRDYYSKEKQMVKSMIKDERIHLCLYFVESYGEPLRQIDALILEKISKISNVVLVVGKSDILTNDEKAVFHDEIVRKLSENAISLFEPKDSDNLIYFIASKRQSVFNIDEGDLNDLHELIIRRGMTDLIEQTDTYYEAFRTGELTKDFGTSSPNEEEVQMSNEFIEMMNADEKRIDEARLEYVRRKNEYEERIGETNHTGSDY